MWGYKVRGAAGRTIYESAVVYLHAASAMAMPGQAKPRLQCTVLIITFTKKGLEHNVECVGNLVVKQANNCVIRVDSALAQERSQWE